MAATQCDRDAFLRNLQQSGLLQPREFRKVIETLPDSDRGWDVARSLVKKGVLTRFQAELLLIGRTHGFFLGQYKILDQLGQGGMGRVYKAMHMTMKRIVALKVLAPQLVRTDKAMKMFKHEVRAAAQLHHPNIVTAFDANQIKNRHYLVMEYVDGPNLDELVRQRGPLSVGLACELIRQSAVGLQYAHEMGLIHLDIKPANLLVSEETVASGQWPVASKARVSLPPTDRSPLASRHSSLRVKILDFGLARLNEPAAPVDSDELTKVGKGNTILGTPDFLSPEQSRNLPGLDTRSDIYSLGCTFFFLLTGRVPFPGGTTLEKLVRHSTEEPMSVELFRSDVPAQVLAALEKMLAKKPEDRFQSQQEVALALAPFAKVMPEEVDLNAVNPPLTSPTLSNGAEGKVGLRETPVDPAATVPPDQALTPISDDEFFPFSSQVEKPARWPLWMLIALGGVVGALTVAAVLLLIR